MREFLSYVLESFRDATGWSRDNGYADLNVTANELLNFQTPRGLRMTLSSLATPHFATSYNLGSIGVVDGSISYLYSSVPLSNVIAQSESIPLPTLLRSYRQLHSALPPSLAPSISSRTLQRIGPESILPFYGTASSTPATSSSSTSLKSALLVPAADQLANLIHEARLLVDKPALLYGRLYLPRSMLEAYMVKRLASSVQLQLRAVSDAKLPSGGTLLGILQCDRGNYGLEGLASSDGGLLGVRGLYNFRAESTGHGSTQAQPSTVAEGGHSTSGGGSGGDPRLHGARFSAGGEIYYGTLNKSGGISLGARFATLPGHSGTPLTATMTINPLMGNISATYAVVARDNCSLATKFDFNVYSYESEWAVGMELWSKRRLAGLVAVDEDDTSGTASLPLASSRGLPPQPSSSPGISKEAQKPRERSFQAKLEWRLDEPITERAAEPSTVVVDSTAEESYQGVLKARLDQNLKIGLLWEGRIKSLLFSLGSAVDLHRLDQPFRTLGLEIQFSS